MDGLNRLIAWRANHKREVEARRRASWVIEIKAAK